METSASGSGCVLTVKRSVDDPWPGCRSMGS